MAEKPVSGPLAEANLANERGLDPYLPGSLRCAPEGGSPGSRRILEVRGYERQLLFLEAGADPPGIDPVGRVPLGEMEGSESCS